MNAEMLALAAMEARKFSYCPYSGFSVGAALLSENGAIYTGCNIENAAYSPTNCAERTAFFKAVSEGEKRFSAIAVCGGPAGLEPVDFCWPCGVCRQVMMEFCDPERFIVISVKCPTDLERCYLRDLLPRSFGQTDLEKAR